MVQSTVHKENPYRYYHAEECTLLTCHVVYHVHVHKAPPGAIVLCGIVQVLTDYFSAKKL